MLYSVSEVSKRLNISKVTVYKKLDKVNELKVHVKQTKDGKLISEEGFQILKRLLQDSTFIKHSQQEFTQEEEKQDIATDLMAYKRLTENLEKQVKDLQADKNKLYEQIQSLTRLTENSQVLLKQQQDKIFLLEHPQETAQQREKPSIWQRLWS